MTFNGLTRLSLLALGLALSLAACDPGGTSSMMDGGNEPLPGALGSICARNADCNSGLCLAAGRCTEPCATAAECPNSWVCEGLPGTGLICQCNAMAPEELCNGIDDECDGRIDNGATCGPGLVCEGGECLCPASERCAGACVDRMSDVANCGACGNACAAGQVCESGACVVNCSATTTRCGDSCVDTNTNANNCGACGTSCGAGGVCEGGTCMCTGSLSLCVGVGCVDTNTDRMNCGGCGNACTSEELCRSASCECAAGRTRCGTACPDTMTDEMHCGACGNACAAGQTCEAGSCVVTCTTPLTRCGTACVDTRSSAANCGSCGNACAAGELCGMSTCRTDCGSLTLCDGACVDTTDDSANCGSCGNSCGALGFCRASTCACGFGSDFCGGECINTDSDPNNCGSCGMRCSGGATCRFGTCETPVTPVPVGRACTSDSQCVPTSGGLCFTAAEGFPGGYCSMPCGSCPTGATCVNVGAPSPICLDDCASAGECRATYTCEPLADGGGVCFPPG
jgi:hypothetical protein